MSCKNLADAIELLSNNLDDGLATDRMYQLATAHDSSAPDLDGACAPDSKITPHRLSARLSDKQIATAVSRYESGDSATIIARALDVAPSALLRLLREKGVTVRKDGVTTESARQMAQEYEAGATMAEIEKKYGLSHSTVYRALHRSGVSVRSTGRRPGRPMRIR